MFYIQDHGVISQQYSSTGFKNTTVFTVTYD